MSRPNFTFTSESVSEGHPDKVCDRISDAVLDAFISQEPEARVACETFATTNRVIIGGEVGLSDKNILKDYMGRIDHIARSCIKDIGYEQEKFHHQTVEVTNLLHEQSAHIAQGVNAGENKAVAQASHGSAPDIAGEDIANPSALLLSTGMLFDWLAEKNDSNALKEAARLVRSSMEQVFTQPDNLTSDLNGSLGTIEFGRQIIRKIEEL